MNGLALTKLDVLDSFEKIKVCTSYTYNNKKYDYFPLGVEDLSQLSTNYVELDGWNEKTKNKRIFSDLPANAKNIYLL